MQQDIHILNQHEILSIVHVLEYSNWKKMFLIPDPLSGHGCGDRVKNFLF
jgi:hypothetical protein